MYCEQSPMSLGSLWVDSRKINLEPDYQRESNVWSLDKKQLLIDSLLNNYDTPKIYLHDLRQKADEFDFAVIDGKQRLTTMWDFIRGSFPLGDSFKFSETKQGESPKPGDCFEDFSDLWKEKLKNSLLSVTRVLNADKDDIEELFQRLNNASTLTAAEQRNGMGGDMAKLIREIGKHKFFTQSVSFADRRYSHREVAAKILRLEKFNLDEKKSYCAIAKKFLDDLVEKNKAMNSKDYEKLKKAVEKNLDSMTIIFSKKDALLKKITATHLYYIFIRDIKKAYGSESMNSVLTKFMNEFEAKRIENSKIVDDEDDTKKDKDLTEYQNLMQHGTNNPANIETRMEVLYKKFLLWNSNVQIKDPKRTFTREERFVLWYNADEKCVQCGNKVLFDEVDGGHIEDHIKGGKTILSNGRCECKSCNRA